MILDFIIAHPDESVPRNRSRQDRLLHPPDGHPAHRLAGPNLPRNQVRCEHQTLLCRPFSHLSPGFRQRLSDFLRWSLSPTATPPEQAFPVLHAPPPVRKAPAPLRVSTSFSPLPSPINSTGRGPFSPKYSAPKLAQRPPPAPLFRAPEALGDPAHGRSNPCRPGLFTGDDAAISGQNYEAAYQKWATEGLSEDQIQALIRPDDPEKGSFHTYLQPDSYPIFATESSRDYRRPAQDRSTSTPSISASPPCER